MLRVDKFDNGTVVRPESVDIEEGMNELEWQEFINEVIQYFVIDTHQWLEHYQSKLTGIVLK